MTEEIQIYVQIIFLVVLVECTSHKQHQYISYECPTALCILIPNIPWAHY